MWKENLREKVEQDSDRKYCWKSNSHPPVETWKIWKFFWKLRCLQERLGTRGDITLLGYSIKRRCILKIWKNILYSIYYFSSNSSQQNMESHISHLRERKKKSSTGFPLDLNIRLIKNKTQHWGQLSPMFLCWCRGFRIPLPSRRDPKLLQGRLNL